MSLTRDQWYKVALKLVTDAERDLGHLTGGERRDLLLDRTDMDRPSVTEIVARMPKHFCQCGSGQDRYELIDARGIFCCYVCEKCEDEKRSHYRADIFEDADYWHDEPLDEDY